MGPCPGCGASTEVGDRFCTGCGEALSAPSPASDGAGHPAATDETPTAVDEPELLLADTATSRALTHDAASRRGGPSVGVWAVVVVGIVMVGIAVWAIGRAGADRPDTGPESAARDDGSTGDPPPATTTAPTERAGTDDTVTDQGTVATYDPGDPADVGPVMGQETGWSLIVGSRFYPGLERIDLDTGEQVSYDEAIGAPILAVDGTLVLQRDADDGTATLYLVPLDDPAADGAPVAVGAQTSGFSQTVFPAGDGGLWVYARTPEATTWRLVRLRDGKQIDELPAPAANQVSPVSGGGPFVVTSPAGGLYRRDGDGFRLVSSGSPITVHRDAALVRVCSSPSACRLQWIDVDTGEAVDRTLPPVDDVDGWSGVVDPAGRFLVGWRLGVGAADIETVLYDLDEERVVDPQGGFGDGLLAATPDGRYLAFSGPDAVRVYDAEEGRTVDVRLRGDGMDGAVFVANGAR